MISASDSINGVAKGTTGYSYDAKDRLTSIQQSGAGVANKRVDYTYNAVGQPLTTKRYSDLAGTQVVADSNLTYDALSRPTNMTHSKGGVNTAFYNYTYDANSRITNVSNKDGTSAYTYDDVDQLTGANYSFQPSETYTYDLNGNRTNAGYQTGLNNRLLSDGTFNYEYDNEGNLIKQTDIVTGEVTQNTWDYRNRLTNVTRNGVAVGAYTYDTYDQRIGKSANGTTERFVYGQNQNIALEFDGGGVQTHRYLHGNGIDQILADEASGAVGWTLSDNLGTVRDVVDGSGSSQNHIAYNSFGNVTSESNPSFDTRFTFTGRELDAETGNYDYRNRQYNPRSGRFIEEDPIGFNAGDTNLYRYVKNSPLKYTDSLGLWGKVVFQQRHILYSKKDVDSDIKQVAVYPYGIPLPFIGFGIPEQYFFPAQYSPFFTLNPGGVNANPPISNSSDKVISDVTKANIEWSDSEPPDGTVSPWGGLYTGIFPNDQKGHIIPRELGGKKEANNFFSQNQSINQGGYRVFGSDVRKYLDQLHKDCPSSTAKVELTVDLLHRGVGAIQGFPLRPDRVQVIAVFSDGKRISGRFSNVHGVSSRRGTSFSYNRVPN